MQFPIALVVSIVLHSAMLLVLVSSMEFVTPKHTPQPMQAEVVNAVSVDKTALAQQIKKLEQQKMAKQQAEEQRVAELERRARAAEQKRRANEQNIEKLSKQRKQAEAEARAAKERQIKEAERAKKLKQEVEKQEAAKRRAQEQARKAAEEAKKAEAEAKRKAEALKKAEEERKRKEREALEKAEQQRLLEQQMKAEMEARNAQRQQYIMSERDKYVALIRSAIQSNLFTDPSLAGTSCKLNIKLANNGFVTQVKTLSGHPQTCQEAERAVYKTNQMPVSEDPEVTAQLRDINLTVAPEK
ncbi:protein TolA [Catenovulum agarivorans DS-2]|uniref:Protein TolA n=1 Tax=Catenovulum agarivorans DS-2 TaxID=1328313 RepID=W7R089_9ALTE|nr:cell envelope integrity protein TolA [Catenovulum agarivorans]EWH11035.1 protein TolA [Catenovulum agarivorans DS-2]